MLRCYRLANLAKSQKLLLHVPAPNSLRACGRRVGSDRQGCCYARVRQLNRLKTANSGVSFRVALALGTVAAAAGGGVWITSALLDQKEGIMHRVGILDNETPTPKGSGGLDSTAADDTEPAGLIYRFAALLRRLTQRGVNIFKAVIIDGIVEVALTVVRSGELLVYFVPLILTYPVVWFGKKDPDHGNARRGELWWYRFLRMQMTRAGATFVKLSQWAASRTDLFNEQVCLELGHLHDSNAAHSAEYSKQVIVREFGVDSIDDVFEAFDDNALGAGAVAQVHYARFSGSFIDKLSTSLDKEDRMAAKYLSENPSVAIKVLHPNVDRTIRRDLRIMYWASSVLGFIPGFKWLSLPEEVALFGDMMISQVNLLVEANNLEKFKNNFAKRHGISFPRAVLPLSSEHVLVEHFEDAVPLSAFLNVSGHTIYDKELGSKGLGAFLHMLIYDNFVHADLHPGNILVRLSPPFIGTPLDRFVEDFYEMSPFNRSREQQPKTQLSSSQVHKHIRDILNKAEAGDITQPEKTEQLHEYMNYLYKNGYTPELVILDCGLATSLDDQNRQNFLDLFESVCTFNGERAGMLMIERCSTPELVVNPEIFKLRIQDIILKVQKVSLQLSKLTFADIFAPVMNSVRVHHVKLTPDFINIIMAMFILEGIGRRLDPDSDILKVALPMLRKWLKEDAKHEFVNRSYRGNMSTWYLYWVWIYVEFREYIERIRYWGCDDELFFGDFSPFITADSSIA